MTKEQRYKQLEELIKASDETQLTLLRPTIEMLADLETRLADLRKHDFIVFNPKNKNQSKQTAAGKQYKELSQIYDNKLKIILKAIKHIDTDENDGLQEFLEAWKNGG